MSQTQNPFQPPISRRRRNFQNSFTSDAPKSAQALSMMFSHTAEEQAELDQIGRGGDSNSHFPRGGRGSSSDSSSDDGDLPLEFQKKNSGASEIVEQTLQGKAKVLPSIIKFKKQMKRKQESLMRKQIKEQEKKRQQISKFYGGRSKIDKDNGFIINDDKIWEGVPEEQRRRMQSRDFMAAADGKDLFVLDEVSETESVQSADEEFCQDLDSASDDVKVKHPFLKERKKKDLSCLGGHWQNSGFLEDSISDESSETERSPYKLIKKKSKKLKTQQKSGVLASGNKESSRQSLGDELKEITKKFRKTQKSDKFNLKKMELQNQRMSDQITYDDDENEVDLGGAQEVQCDQNEEIDIEALISSDEDENQFGAICIDDSDSDVREQKLQQYMDQLKSTMPASKSREEILEWHFKHQELEKQRQFLKQRYEHRQRIDELQFMILSGQIFEQFSEIKPQDFENYVLPIDFGDHYTYREKWEKLFFYELFNFLMSVSRRGDIEEAQQKAIAKDQGLSIEPFKRPKRAMKWRGYIQCSTSEVYFQNIKMFDIPPAAPDNEEKTSKKHNKEEVKKHWIDQVTPGFSIRQIKEQDLIVMTEEELDLKGKDDIKSISDVKFLNNILQRSNAMFAIVQKKASQTKGKMVGAKLLVHNSKSFFLEQAEAEHGYAPMYCYFYENILTTIREYKTLRMSEFLRMTPLILNPSLTAKMDRDTRDKLLKDNTKELEFAIKKGHIFGVPKGEEFIPMRHAKNVVQQVDPDTKMRLYTQRNRKLFNPSQLIVLDKVIDMLENDILLIQGPPGTGKTHTITGIISMLLDSGAKKLMVCAPSNAAIDEIVSRIARNGFIGTPEKGDLTSILGRENAHAADGLLLRIGAADYEPSAEVKQHTLDERLADTLCGKRVYTLRQKIEVANELLHILNQDADVNGGQGQLLFSSRHHAQCIMTLFGASNAVGAKKFIKKNTKEDHIKMIEKIKASSEAKLKEIMEGEHEKKGSDWKLVENQLLLKSQIICCTLALSGVDKLEALKNCVDYLIVDEACQCIEPASLIPFELGPKKVILVGDQKQLPATTFSENSFVTHYSRSLFERLLLAGHDRTMLDIQYRMHPSISRFPSKKFYESKIQDHNSIMRREMSPTLTKIWEQLGNRMIFFDLVDSHESVEDKSKCNPDEAEFSKALVGYLAKEVGSLEALQGMIGIITPYKLQCRQIKNKLDSLCRYHKCNLHETIEVNTVDAFQGREKDMIIFNCVRSNSHINIQSSLGFLIDERRLNVAITRPRHFLIIIGNSNTLVKSDTWRDMINNCKDTETFFPVKVSELKNEKFGIAGLLKQSRQNGHKLARESEGSRNTRPSDNDRLSSTFDQLFPDDQLKSELVRGLYSDAMTESQRQELDKLVNEEQYFDLKRQKR